MGHIGDEKETYAVVSLGNGFVWTCCSHDNKQCLHIWRIRNSFMLDNPKE